MPGSCGSALLRLGHGSVWHDAIIPFEPSKGTPVDTLKEAAHFADRGRALRAMVGADFT